MTWKEYRSELWQSSFRTSDYNVALDRFNMDWLPARLANLRWALFTSIINDSNHSLHSLLHQPMAKPVGGRGRATLGYGHFKSVDTSLVKWIGLYCPVTNIFIWNSLYLLKKIPATSTWVFRVTHWFSYYCYLILNYILSLLLQCL